MLPLADNVPRRHAPVVMWALSGVCLAVFLFELALPPRELEQFILYWGLIPARVRADQALEVGPTFVSSMFLHGGWLHLLGNIWMLWIFGDNVEDRMGKWRFLVFYLLCGIIAAATQAAIGPRSTVPMIGASGAIAGVLGAYGILYPRARVMVIVPIVFYPLMFNASAFLFIGLWFLMQLMSGAQAIVGGIEGGVAWWAHVGGLVGGVLLLPLFLHPDRRHVYELEELDRDPFHDHMWSRLRE